MYNLGVNEKKEEVKFMLTKTIDGLFIGTRYGVWVLAILGIPLSIVLAISNLSSGIPSIIMCVAILLLSSSVALALLPQQLATHKILEKRYYISIVACVIAIAITGIIYFSNAGFPELNLIFI